MQLSAKESNKGTRGFTLIEMMLVLVIAAVLLTVGIPSMRQTLINSRLTGQINDFVAAFQTARSEAVKNNDDVTVCRSAAGDDCDGASWSDGFIIWLDADGDASVDADEILGDGSANAAFSYIGGWSGADIVYRADSSANQSGTVTVCYGADTTEVAGQVTLDITGRASAKKLDFIPGGCP